MQPATPISSEEHPTMQDKRRTRSAPGGTHHRKQSRSGSRSPGNWRLRNSQVSDSEEEMTIIYVRVTLHTDGARTHSIGQKTFELDGGHARAHEPSLGAILAFARCVIPDTTDQDGMSKNNVANVIFSSPGGPIHCIVNPHRKIRQFVKDLPICGGGDDTDNSPVFSLLATVVRKLDERAV